MAAITIKELSKSYGAASEMPAINDLSLTILDNQFVTLLGPSGCGKTTTLRLIAGYMAPDHGTIHVGDRLLSAKGSVVPPENRGMGMVFQNYAVWPHKTVFENVVFGLRLRKVPAAKAREQVETALALVNLSGLENRLPSELSGGQQQRVALARSLVVEPEILLLDEPLSNLDAKLRERMRTELKQLQRRTGITFIYVTHDQAEAMALSDQVAVIHAGRLQQFGPPHEIYMRPVNRMVADFMGRVNLVPARVVEAANGKGKLQVNGNLVIEGLLPAGIRTGDDVDLAVRPEDVILGPDAAMRQDHAEAKVTDRIFLGNICEYDVVLASGEALKVQTHPKLRFGVGDTVAMAVDGGQISVFPRSSADKA
ncbi:MAG TPA: ABC transporter ATP-binding protein [Xanthobacteraceae bacterium]|jgi:iron(III) transport system ATP-binding protein|nr:ABC transporter ATP-binding protein [Xanthobacteraceae bacterium]